MSSSVKGARVIELGELRLIERIKPLMPERADIVVGVGDDCAVLRPSSESREDWVLKSDPVIAGRHFLAEEDPFRIGHKAMGRVLSDLASMGAEPRWALINLVLSGDCLVETVDGLYAGMLELANRHGLALVGGDTAQGSELALHVFACGALPRGTARLRSGGVVGDSLYVTGQLGGSLQGKHLDFEPRVEEGRFLRDFANAMIDISDGLASELWHIASAGGLVLEVDAAGIPLSEAAKSAPAPLRSALGDGEDFELLFSVPPEREERMLRKWSAAFPGLACTKIGEIAGAAAAGEVYLTTESGRSFMPRGGFEHFAG